MIELPNKTASLRVAALSMVLVAAGSLPRAFAQEEQRIDSRATSADADDPRARENYLLSKRGGPAPEGARVHALEQLDKMLERDGQLFRESVAASVQLSSAASPAVNIASNPSSWTFIGPQQTTGNRAGVTSGRVTAIAVDPTDSNIVYLGAAQGGVWKTTDGGTSWTPLTDNQASLATGSIAIDPNNHNVVYVGTGEQNYNGDGYYGAGILKSTDGGSNWTLLKNPGFDGTSGQGIGFPSIGAMAVQPGVTSGAPIVLAGVRGGGPPGLYISRDGGLSWTQAAAIAALNSGGGASVNSIVYASNQIVYAGVFRNGVYKSIDGGLTWAAANGAVGLKPFPTAASLGCSSSNVGCRTMVGASLHNASVVYASINDGNSKGDNLAGVFKSVDGGANWTKLGPSSTNGLVDYCTPQCWYDQVLAVSPANENVVFLGGSAATNNSVIDSILFSSNGGTSWTAQGNAQTIHVDHHAGAFSATGSKLYWGTDGGVYSTTNVGGTLITGAVTWTNLNHALGIAQFYGGFAIHPTDPTITYGGTQDNGTQEFTNALTWSDVTCGDGVAAVFDSSTPSTVYASCQNINILKSTSNNAFFQVGSVGNIVDTRFPFIAAMIGDGALSSPTRIYFGTTRVWVSADAGTTWTAISGDLSTGGGSQPDPNVNVISNMAVSPTNKDVLYVVTGDGKVQKSTNATQASPAFLDITGTGLPAGRFINAVAVDPADPNTAYAAVSGFSNTVTPTGHVYKISGTATTWTDVNIAGDLPNSPANDIVIDPDLPNTLYVATDIGVFQSSNGGTNWTALGAGLPRVAVFGLKLHRPSRTLRAATHGRGMWDLSVPAAGTLDVVPNVDFPSQLVGTTSMVQPVTIAAQHGQVTALSVGSASGDFSSTTNCPVSLLGSCLVNISFSPTAVGTRTSILTVTSSSAGSPQVIAISGTGFDANLNLVRPARPSRNATGGGIANVSGGEAAQIAVSLQTTSPVPQRVNFTCESGNRNVHCALSQASATLERGAVAVQLQLSSGRIPHVRSGNYTATVTAHFASGVRTLEVPYVFSASSSVRSLRLTAR